MKQKLAYRFLVIVFALFATCGLGVSAHAFDMPGVDFLSPTVDFTNGNWSLGWEFTVGSSNLALDALGFYNGSGVPTVIGSPEVGIFNSAGTLLTSTTVTQGDAVVSWWTWSSALSSPLILQKGQTYDVMAVTGSNVYTWNPTGFTVSPYITFVQDEFYTPPSGVLAFPNASSGVTGWFGPNIDFRPTTVPVPPSLLLLAPGLLGVVGLRKRFFG